LSPASEPKRRGAEYSTSPQLTFNTCNICRMANNTSTNAHPVTMSASLHGERTPEGEENTAE
ncbi:MAG: hypothetical protein IKR83_05460, partial [Bacteroidales bacterium]|nr:hypothetical protein [Bacteroidales bacterium]